MYSSPIIMDVYRQCMIRWRRCESNPYKPAKVCYTCAGWEHFGGRLTRDVTMGPVCVCDKVWNKVLRDLDRRINKIHA